MRTICYHDVHGGDGANSERWTPKTGPSLCIDTWVSRLTCSHVPLTDIQSLWGNPNHLSYLATSLRGKHSKEKLHILVAKTNSDTYTYDGIDLGAERVTQEIEAHVDDLEKDGSQINKLSVIGYSLGGLVARYAIGLLYSKGWFQRIEPINFTTFATPHLGVRTPFPGVPYQVWNTLGSRTLSISGRQLFTIDTFRETGRSLLSVLADHNSIFMLALSRFKHRVLYANIINDRSAPYYTTSISVTDPYTNLDAISLNYLPAYAPIILNPADPVHFKPPENQPPFFTRLAGSSSSLLTRIPIYAMLLILIPVGSVVYLINSGVQSVRSQKRIRLHEEGKAGIGLGSYRIPLMVENARITMEGAIENMNAGRGRQYLPSAASEANSNSKLPYDGQENGHAKRHRQSSSGGSSLSDLKRADSHHHDFPTLALTSQQFAMVQALDDVGFRKYCVHIHADRHSHAAIIVRKQKKSFEEGKTVVNHWFVLFGVILPQCRPCFKSSDMFWSKASTTFLCSL